MIEQNIDSLQGFEERLQNAISDLEGALLGISDEEIQLELKSKGYTILSETGFQSFKNELKKAALNKDVERNPNMTSDDEAMLHERPTSEESLDFDVSLSSYMKIPRSDKATFGTEVQKDIFRIFSDLSSSTGNSDSDLLSEIFLRVWQECSCVLEPGQSSFTDDVVDSNPELPQPSGGEDGAIRQRCNTGGTVPSLRSTIDVKKRGHHVTHAPAPFDSSRLTMSGPIGRNYRTLEQFMRKECSIQMNLISRFSGRPESVWVPTKPKCSPQARYQQYRKFWEKFPVPGQKARKVLRWDIRNQMAQKEEPQKVSWWPEIRLS